jgi:hypothetical protein
MAYAAAVSLKRRVDGMMIGLGIQFILGMLVNLFGSAPDDPKYATESVVIKLSFFVHAVIGLSLLVGAVTIYAISRKSGVAGWARSGVLGLLSILFAFGSGIATVILHGSASEIGSFLMALGFILAYASYGSFYTIFKP